MGTKKKTSPELKSLLRETITMMCKNGLSYQSKLSIDAVIGITLDENDVMLVAINNTCIRQGLDLDLIQDNQDCLDGLEIDEMCEADMEEDGESQVQGNGGHGDNIMSVHGIVPAYLSGGTKACTKVKDSGTTKSTKTPLQRPVSKDSSTTKSDDTKPVDTNAMSAAIPFLHQRPLPEVPTVPEDIAKTTEARDKINISSQVQHISAGTRKGTNTSQVFISGTVTPESDPFGCDTLKAKGTNSTRSSDIRTPEDVAIQDSVTEAQEVVSVAVSGSAGDDNMLVANTPPSASSFADFEDDLHTVIVQGMDGSEAVYQVPVGYTLVPQGNGDMVLAPCSPEHVGTDSLDADILAEDAASPQAGRGQLDTHTADVEHDLLDENIGEPAPVVKLEPMSLEQPRQKRKYTRRKDRLDMPKAKTRERNYSKSLLSIAVNLVKEKKLTLKQASDIYDVPKSTIYDKLRNRSSVDCKRGPATKLTSEEEGLIEQWVLSRLAADCELQVRDVLLFAKSLLDQTGRRTRFDSNMPGPQWWKLFLSRHPDVSACFGRQSKKKTIAPRNQDRKAPLIPT